MTLQMPNAEPAGATGVAPADSAPPAASWSGVRPRAPRAVGGPRAAGRATDADGRPARGRRAEAGDDGQHPPGGAARAGAGGRVRAHGCDLMPPANPTRARRDTEHIVLSAETAA